MTKVTLLWLDLATLYDEARVDGLCHAGAWEIVFRAVLPLEFSPMELEALENWLML